MSEQKELGRRTKAELEALFGNMYSGWERGVVITQERFGTGETLFSERPMTPLELAARYVAAEIGANIYEIAGRAAFAPIITFSQIQVHIGPVFETLVSERDALVKALQSALDRWNAYADIGEEGAADSRLIRTDEGDLYHECRRVLAAAGETQNG